jgi:hypothetical protein
MANAQRTLAITGSACGSKRLAVDGLDLLEAVRADQLLAGAGQLIQIRDHLLGRVPLAVRGEAHDVAEQHHDAIVALRGHAIMRLELGDRRGRQDGVQQAIGAGPLALDLLHLALDPREIRHLLIAPALLLETGADPRLEEHRVERLRQVVVGAELNAAHHAVYVVERRDHDHRDVAQPGIVLEAPQDLKAAHLRHHDVEEDQIDGLAAQAIKGVAAVDRGHALVVEELQLLREDVAVERLVVDDQDSCRRRHRCSHRRHA